MFSRFGKLIKDDTLKLTFVLPIILLEKFLGNNKKSYCQLKDYARSPTYNRQIEKYFAIQKINCNTIQ